jgi:hypothetical protein
LFSTAETFVLNYSTELNELGLQGSNFYVLEHLLFDWRSLAAGLLLSTMHRKGGCAGCHVDHRQRRHLLQPVISFQIDVFRHRSQ